MSGFVGEMDLSGGGRWRGEEEERDEEDEDGGYGGD